MDLEEMYQSYSRKVYGYLLSLGAAPDAADDLMQETFLKAARKIDSFKGESSLSTWLCAIAKRLWLDDLKKNKRQAMPSAEEMVIGYLDDRRDLSIFLYLHDIDDPYREVIMLRIFAGLSFREIGEIFSKTENWARVTFFRGKEKLRKAAIENDE